MTQVIGFATRLFVLIMAMPVDHNLNLLNVKLFELRVCLYHFKDATIVDFNDRVRSLAQRMNMRLCIMTKFFNRQIKVAFAFDVQLNDQLVLQQEVNVVVDGC
jgi:hypothetical protein